MKTITRDELKAKMDRGDGFVLLEVLPEFAYNQGHLPGAVLFRKAGDVAGQVPDKGTEIVAYCSSPT